MKVAILYICTGKYNQFFKGFFESCEKYLLKDIAQLEYYVFKYDMYLSDESNVHLITQAFRQTLFSASICSYKWDKN